MQNLLREDRHQRNRAPQQHREQVERNRPQQNLCSCNVPKTRQNHILRNSPVLHASGPNLQRAHQHQKPHNGSQRKKVDQTRSMQPPM
jgi:hypothetical protein